MEHAMVIISFGDRVHALIGAAGRIRYLLFDRSRRQLRALVLRRGLTHADYVLPAHIVAPEDDVGGQLQLHEAGEPPSLTLPRRYGLDKVVAALDQSTAGSDSIAAWPFGMESFVLLHAGQPVYGPDGHVGSLQGIVVCWPAWELVALVVCTGRLRRRCVRISQRSIIGWAGDQIHISLGRTDVQALPAYRPDRSIRSAIEHALRHDEVIRGVDGGMIAVHVSDGCVTLRGHVADGRKRERAERLARQVRGVRGVMNELVTDAQLTYDIGRALAHVEPASRSSVGFTVVHGVVVLFGEVPDARVRNAVEAAMGDVPEIRMIINRIRSSGMPEPAMQQRILQPRRGQTVFGHDGYIGCVERVVMDPRLRQVMQIVVSADALAQAAAHDWLEHAPRPRRLLVLPVSVIATLSPVEVFLNIDRRTAARAMEFRPEWYMAPAAEWRAPFPYQRDEIVFESQNLPKADNQQPIPAGSWSIAQQDDESLDSGSRDIRTTHVGAVASD